jgi:hypothetical protein
MLRLLVGFAAARRVVAALRVPRAARGADVRPPGRAGLLQRRAAVLPDHLGRAVVDSALAATLTAPVPLFVIPIAALMLHDERIR